MPSKIVYLNRNGVELYNPTKREIELVSRRSFLRRSTLFLPLAFFAGSLVPKARATSVIVQRTISGGTEQAASMFNSSWARPVVLTPGWTHARVGCRLHFTSTGAGLTGGPLFAYGFNSGTANQYGTPTTQNFIGIAFDAATWSYDGSGTSPVYSVPLNGSQPVLRTRIGTTNTDLRANAGGANASFNAGASTNTADRQISFVDVSTGSPNYTIKAPFLCGLGNPNIPVGDVTAANFLNYMGQLVPTPTEGQYQTASLNSFATPFSESVNPLNAINFYWNRVDLQPELCDIAVAVLA